MNDLSLMRPSAWQLFVDLADEGSLSRLALRSGRAQPQLSRQLAELEAFCGTALFQRHARGLRPSEYGLWVLPQVRAWLAQTLALHDQIRHGEAVAVGEVRLAVIPSAVQAWVMPALLELRRKHPLVRLVVIEALDSQMDQALQSASIDMALRYLQPTRLRPDDQVLQTVGTYLVGPPGDRLTRRRSIPFSALKDVPLALPCRPSLWRDALDALARQRGFDLTVTLEADSLQVQKQAAMQGLAHTLLGPLALDAQSQGLQKALITDPPLPRAMVLTRRPGLALRRAHQEVAQAIMAQVPALRSRA